MVGAREQTAPSSILQQVLRQTQLKKKALSLQPTGDARRGIGRNAFAATAVGGGDASGFHRRKQRRQRHRLVLSPLHSPFLPLLLVLVLLLSLSLPPVLSARTRTGLRKSPLGLGESMTERLKNAGPRLKKLRVLIVGDIFVDRVTRGHDYGTFAGSPVMRYDDEDSDIGGAGNVAACFRALGVSSVTMAAVVGKDAAAEDIRKLLGRYDIVDQMISDEAVSTGVYEKIFSANGTKKILEVWRLPEAALVHDKALERRFADHVARLVKEKHPHVVIAADQAPNVVVTDGVFKSLVRACRASSDSGANSWSGCAVWATSRDENRLVNGGFVGATVVMSNEHEFRVGGMKGQERMSALAKIWERLPPVEYDSGNGNVNIDKLDARPPIVVSTLAANGILVVSSKDGRMPRFDMFPAVSSIEVDATGAGDATITALSSLLAVGAPLDVAAAGAVRAGALGVTKTGCVRSSLATIASAEKIIASQNRTQSTRNRDIIHVGGSSALDLSSTLSSTSLKRSLQCSQDGSISLATGTAALHEARADAGPAALRVVLTSGCFDLLHSGHFQMLNYGAGIGDVLIVAIDTDEHVEELKGAGRPFVGLEDRARAIASFPGVDCVIHTANVTQVILEVKPSVFLKGGDKHISEIPEQEQRACASVTKPEQCEVVLVPMPPAPLHTSTIHSNIVASSCPFLANSSLFDLIFFYFGLIGFAIASLIRLSTNAMRKRKKAKQ